MADSINKYTSEAEYNSASHGITPEVSKVLGSVSPVRYDGRNTDTTGSPSVGDAVYLDPDDNVRFISWKNLVPGALGNGWYPVGVVINRFGRKVRIRYKNYKSLPRVSAMIYVLSNQTSNSITFKIPTAAGTDALVDLGTTFTSTKSLSSDPTGFISELDTWLRSHQPGKNGNPGMVLTWHAEYIGNTPMIICDSTHHSYGSSNINVTCTGITATFTIYYQPPSVFYGNLPISCGYSLDHGIIYNPNAIIAFNIVRTPTSTVGLNTKGNPVSEDAFNNSEYCSTLRSTFATYTEYLDGRVLPCPTQKYEYFTKWNKTAYQNSRTMASYTYPNINGVSTAYYPMCVWANTPDEGTRSSIVNSSFNWYSPGVIEGYYYCCNRGTTMDDPVWSTMGKISDNQATISDLRGATVLNSYKNAWTSWNMYNFAILSYGGGLHEGYFSRPVLSFADYDLTGRT